LVYLQKYILIERTLDNGNDIWNRSIGSFICASHQPGNPPDADPYNGRNGISQGEQSFKA
jgi:hypothetical protein